MRKLFLIFCFFIFPAMAKNLDNAIQKLTRNVEGQIVSPATTEELQNLFKDATETRVPRIFVDKLPADFAENGTGELYMNVITALILRSNEMAIREKVLLMALKNKHNKKEAWTPIEESFFNAMVEKYDVVVNKTIETQLDQLSIKIDEIVPGLAVAQSVYATDWGRKNLNHPYGQMGWLDEKNYDELPYDSLIKATEAYVKEMNSAENYWMWRTRRQRSAHRGTRDRLAYTLAGSLRVYRPEDPYYSATIQKIITNNKPLAKLYEATFIDEKGEKNEKNN